MSSSAPHRRLLDQVDALRYVTVPNAPTYRAIMDVCCGALAHYRIELSPPEILRALREGGYVVEVDDAEELELQFLARLEQWGNLAHTADPQGVERLEDFYRRRLVYHVTDVGEAAHAAVREVEEAIGRSGSLQTNMLVKLGACLPKLIEAGPRADPELLLRLLHDVHTAFGTLTHEANRFMVDLGRLIGEERGAASPERFAAFKRAVLAYIGRFVDELRRRSETIAEDVRRVSAAGIDAIIQAASRSADLPDFDEDGAARARWAAEQRERWAGITTWFVGDGAQPATVERLAEFAVGAVLSLTRTLARLNDRRGRPVDRTTDFLRLAAWFAATRSEDDAHALWHTAFGLGGARHFHLAEEDAELHATRESWWTSEPVEVPARLRSHGRTGGPGRPPKAADHGRARRWLAQRARRERAQVEAATARFAGRTLRLSDVATLDAAEFDLLLVLLDAALTAPAAADGTYTTRTADGRLEVTLDPAPGGATCRIETPRGRLRAPDMTITVTDLARPSTRTRARLPDPLSKASGAAG